MMSTGEGDPLLRLLQNRYGHTWRISRTQSLWIAVALDPEASHASTVVHHDLDAFLSELEHPPPSTGPHTSLLQAPYFTNRAQTHTNGTYRFQYTAAPGGGTERHP